MENPYIEHGKKFEAKILAGADRVQVKADDGALSDRLQEYAFYMTEQAKESGDALLVMDLHDAVRALRAAGL